MGVFNAHLTGDEKRWLPKPPNDREDVDIKDLLHAYYNTLLFKLQLNCEISLFLKCSKYHFFSTSQGDDSIAFRKFKLLEIPIV